MGGVLLKDSVDSGWRERIIKVPSYFGGKIKTLLLSRMVDEDSYVYRCVLEEPAAGTPIHTFSRVRTRAEANREKAGSGPVVSPGVRRTLEWQEEAKQLNRVGEVLLRLDRRRGGRKSKYRGFLYRGHHTVWIYQESERLRNQRNTRLSLEGIALRLTYKAQEQGFLGRDEQISVDDIKNARRAIRKKR